jgi:(2R)-sulfolactate sulfo-lyase subunit beta
MANIAKKRDLSFLGYRRENGRVGIRNHVVILPLDDLSNAACEAVANNIKGTLALPHAYGRLQFGEDLELHFRTLIGTGSSPNVAAVVVIGIEPGWTGRVVEGIKKKTGKPVAGFAIEGKGDLQTIADASRVAKAFLQDASEKQREKCRIEELWVSTKCGESDTTSGLASCPTVGNLIDKLDPLGATSCFGETTELTGAEAECAKRAATPAVAKKFMDAFNAYQQVVERHKTNDLSDSQPTKGNIAGGLTTIEEKAFGNFQKIGHKTRFIDVLKPAEEPSKGAGLYFMDTSSAAAECVTLQAAAGFVVHLFPTGQGNVIGNPIEPVIKLTANPKTARTMPEHIDLDVSGILRREMTLDQAGDALIDITLRTCNGRLTCAEALGHREFVMTKLYQSA